jgi:hypothetical protein
MHEQIDCRFCRNLLARIPNEVMPALNSFAVVVFSTVSSKMVVAQRQLRMREERQ